MKDCKTCYHYKKSITKCNKFKMNVTDSNVFALCCKEYSKKTITKVQCRSCINMNKYGWCNMKRRCFNDEERNKDRQCRFYFMRKIRNKKLKKVSNG